MYFEPWLRRKFQCVQCGWQVPQWTAVSAAESRRALEIHMRSHVKAKNNGSQQYISDATLKSGL